MKKIIYSIFALSVGLAVGGCDKYDYKEAVQTLFVVESDLDFTAEGGDGFITVRTDRDGAITAKSNQEWCTVSVSGLLVNVEVTPNEQLYNRTALVTISLGDESQTVPATQLRGFFALYDNLVEAPWEGGTYQIGMQTFTPVILETDEDWITATATDDTITITVAENLVPKKREGTIKVIAGVIWQTITVKQKGQPEEPLDFPDLLGQWYLTYNDENGKAYNNTLTFADDGDPFYSVTGWRNLSNPILLEYDSATGNLIMSMGQVILGGTPTSTWIYYNMAVDFTDMWYSFDTSVQLVGYWNGERDTPEFEFDDNGTFPGYHVDGWAWGRFDNNDGTFDSYYYATLGMKMVRP